MPDDRSGNPSRHYIQDRPDFVRKGRWWQPLNYLARCLNREIAAAIESLEVAPDACVVDYGCANMPYRDRFPTGCTYLGADLAGNPAASVEINEQGRIALGDASADLVLSSQVLEHVEDPVAYLEEAFRVLRPGGQLLLSTHGMMYLHRDPVDYWRWTCDGLSKIIGEAGFEITRFEGVFGLATTGWLLILSGPWSKLPRWIRPFWSLLNQGMMVVSERMHSRSSRRQNALVFVVCARKPGGGQ